MGALVRLHWCLCSGGRNFGDVLGPVLVRELGGVDVEWSPIETAEAVTVGSVMNRIPDRWAGTILGTGTIAAGGRHDLSNARVLAVRGQLTAEAENLRVPLGDPGILVTDLWPDIVADPRVPIAIAPHYVDRDMAKRHPKAVNIDVLAGHRAVLQAIAGAALLITSSLHAMIAADALGVRHVVELHPKVIGGAWKFRDYCSAFGEEFTPGVARLTPRAAMAERQAVLRGLFAQLPAEVYA